MELIKSLNSIKQAYAQGRNMIEFMRDITMESGNSLESILISYDFQAGNYIKKSQLLDNFENESADKVVSLFRQYDDVHSILEVGVGEATTLARVKTRIGPDFDFYGFDISWSRIKYAMKHLKAKNLNGVELFVGDLFNIPLQDNSIDLVYTWHSLEPNGMREHAALKELYRITKKYLFIFEPSYELGDKATRDHITKHGFVKNLQGAARDLGYNIVDYKLVSERNPLSANNTSLLLITKDRGTPPAGDPFACPISKAPLQLMRENYYCKESMLLYPVVDGVPCLLPGNAIIATHYLDDFNELSII